MCDALCITYDLHHALCALRYASQDRFYCRIEIVAVRHQAFLGIGSNQGAKLENCEKALERVGLLPDTRLEKRSSWFKTEPWGTSAEWYMNGAAALRTNLEPWTLLACCHAIERSMGRHRTGMRWEDRIIDLDLLLFDDRVVGDPLLEIPHPGLHKRRFVLTPMCEIAPRVVHPVLAMSMAELLARVEDEKQVWPISGNGRD